ncbi:MAG: hypothetical protein Q9163_000489 [Psora crenata]
MAIAIFILQTCIALLAFFYIINYLRAIFQRRDPKACKRIGLVSSTNLTDELHSRYDGEWQKVEEGKWKVKSLWVYPVKSCRGVELDRSALTGVGIEHDRRFSFAQYTNLNYGEPLSYGWKFMTQREIPALAKVSVEVWVPDSSSPTYDLQHENVQSGGVLVIKWPAYSQGSSLRHRFWMSLTSRSEIAVQLPYHPTPSQIQSNGYEMQDMKIWGDTTPSLLLACTKKYSVPSGKGGKDGKDGKETWIAELVRFLDAECRYRNPPLRKEKDEDRPRSFVDKEKPFGLFRVGSEQPRQVYRNAPRKKEVGYQPTVGFQDSYPLHILNLASVRDLAKKLTSGSPQVSTKNFRPNIIITGGEAYVEDGWKRIKIGSDEYYVCCRTTRCLLPNVDPSTARTDRVEPNKTLRKLRCIDEGAPKHACFGMQMIPAAEERREMKVGDEIEILETGEHYYLKG